MNAEVEARDRKKLVAVVLGLSAVIGLMLLAFVLPSVNSGPHELKLGITGPAPATEQISTSLEASKQGAFDTREFADADALRDAIRNRDVVGGIAVDANGPHVLIATAGGTPIAQTLTGVANGLSEASGAKVPVEDVVPLTADDPTGAGLTALALPLVFGGIMPAVVLVQLFPRSIVKRVLGAAGVAVVAGFALTAILQFGTNSLDGNYLLTALALTMGMSAISLPILGLESLLGMKGFALGAVTMMFIGNPLSGMATTAAWLPAGWGAFGQLLPPGAAGASVRSMAFFDGHGAATPLLVLVCWIAVGIALCVAAGRKKASTPVVEPEAALV
ncbi:ABC transporter permease [Rhodococcus erythropolis]|uniref:ABC transporter permease n=1 Tax=Rhodococcus erythropolis TaxID=1833 RepID=A0A8I1D753_RHOER|nr:ABC transporter permease [Rhodococcus erythropolis]MBF7732191.1 ABC transporter permease [Rhodococcus erythropolis]MBH5145980.1 ABC transporter permease [Rhodococcus erythropolis]MCZ4640847.1 ABC transporter permease [Rhodococcus erythropolis]MQP32866.1 ABC transporter permease [Rhodococcus erythropolis]